MTSTTTNESSDKNTAAAINASLLNNTMNLENEVNNLTKSISPPENPPPPLPLNLISSKFFVPPLPPLPMTSASVPPPPLPQRGPPPLPPRTPPQRPPLPAKTFIALSNDNHTETTTATLSDIQPLNSSSTKIKSPRAQEKPILTNVILTEEKFKGISAVKKSSTAGSSSSFTGATQTYIDNTRHYLHRDLIGKFLKFF